MRTGSLLCTALAGAVLWSAGPAACTARSETVVADGLQWLADHQLSDGSWSFDQEGVPQAARFANPGKCASKTGATGLALLPFLGAGQTHKNGRYQETVRAGLRFLVNRMKTGPDGGDFQGKGDEPVWPAVATLALCEAYSMTRDKALYVPAQKALDHIASTQDEKTGGWAPKPGAAPTTLLVAWQIMALKSGHMAYLRVPPEVVKRAIQYLDSVAIDGGARYGRSSPQTPNDAATAAGLLSRMFVGWKRENPALQQGVAYLDKLGPSKIDLVFNYYATQVMHHHEGDLWRRWNSVMRDRLVDTQVTGPDEAGSWFNPDEVRAAAGGRLFQTALSLMILEVYYRHMPVIGRQATEEEFPLD